MGCQRQNADDAARQVIPARVAAERCVPAIVRDHAGAHEEYRVRRQGRPEFHGLMANAIHDPVNSAAKGLEVAAKSKQLRARSGVRQAAWQCARRALMSRDAAGMGSDVLRMRLV